MSFKTAVHNIGNLQQNVRLPKQLLLLAEHHKAGSSDHQRTVTHCCQKGISAVIVVSDSPSTGIWNPWCSGMLTLVMS